MDRLEADLLAATRDEAVTLLERAGFSVEVLHTGASGGLPGGCAPERVVRFRLRESTGIITVACEMTAFLGDRKSYSKAGGVLPGL